MEALMARSTKYIHLRIFVYVFASVLYISTASVVLWRISRITDDPELDYYYPFWPRTFTIWTVLMQMFHAIIGIYCDKNLLDKAKGNVKDLDNLRKFKSTYFSCIVWPSTWSCSIIYWFFYHYEGELVKVSLTEKVMSSVMNHVAHTFIVFVVLWEAVFQPRVEPRSHKTNVVLALSTVVVYILMLCYTYTTSGTWVYPFFDESYGTIYFPLIHVATCLLIVGAYYAQWPISRVAGLVFSLEIKQTKEKSI